MPDESCQVRKRFADVLLAALSPITSWLCTVEGRIERWGSK